MWLLTPKDKIKDALVNKKIKHTKISKDDPKNNLNKDLHEFEIDENVKVSYQWDEADVLAILPKIEENIEVAYKKKNSK